jgi:uncharacterized protein
MSIEIGKFNLLTVKEVRSAKVVMASDEGEEVIINKKNLSKEPERGDELNVFVYTDQEGNLTGTTSKPYAEVGEFAFMRVLEETTIGAFMDWGIEKDLYVPFSQQRDKMKQGFNYLIYVHFDEETGRIIGSSKVSQFIDNEAPKLKEGDEVNILICDQTDLGTKVIVENKYWGLLYRNEIFQKLKKGERTRGYIKKIREEGKLDVSLQEQGYDEIFSATLKLLKKLKEEGGFLPLTDKTEPVEIYKSVQMSKKVFKKAVGALYKEKKIALVENGIKLIEEGN